MRINLTYSPTREGGPTRPLYTIYENGCAVTSTRNYSILIRWLRKNGLQIPAEHARSGHPFECYLEPRTRKPCGPRAHVTHKLRLTAVENDALMAVSNGKPLEYLHMLVTAQIPKLTA